MNRMRNVCIICLWWIGSISRTSVTKLLITNHGNFWGNPHSCPLASALIITMMTPLLLPLLLFHPPPHLHLHFHLHPTLCAFSSSFFSSRPPPCTSAFVRGRWSCAWSSPQSPRWSGSSCRSSLLPPASYGSILGRGGVSPPLRLGWGWSSRDAGPPL